MDYNERQPRWQKRFEAILNLRGEKVLGLMTNLSNEGMEVRVASRFEVNDEVSVRIITPLGERFNYLSEVRWWRPAIGDRIAKGLFRHGLRHLAVDPEHSRLCEMVQHNPQRRQEAQRFDVDLPIWLSSHPELGECRTVNISARGLFVALPEVPPPYREDKVRISLTLPGDFGTFQSPARVVHIIQPSYAAKLDFPVGTGLQFLHAAPEEMNTLTRYLETLAAALPQAPLGDEPETSPASEEK